MIMKKLWLWFRKSGSGPANGQSLVEMAVVTPLLIFMLIGVFEVGWALRSYLVLVNVNREVTRFAVRPGYMNFSTIQTTQESYQRVREWAESSIGEQLSLDFDNNDGNVTLIISHIVADTGKPCEEVNASCDCERFLTDPNYNPFPQDDIIIHPGLAGYGYQSALFGPITTTTGVRATRVDYGTLIADLSAKNNEFNCKIMQKDGVASSNNVIVTEMFYDLPQLFGFPIISNPYTDPIQLYTHTTMRLVGAARSSGRVEGNITAGIEQIGSICLVYPMLIKDDMAANANPQNIIQHGWLKWGDSILNDEFYLSYALQYPQMSLNDFDTPGGIRKGSQVNKVNGVYSGLADELAGLSGLRIIIPTSSDPQSNRPTINGFVWATISDADLTNKIVTARVDTNNLPESCTSPLLPE